MGAVERARYKLVCPQCGRAGKAEWSENDGFTYMRHGPHPSVDISERLHMMMWTASPQRHHSAKAWSQERHKEGDRP